MPVRRVIETLTGPRLEAVRRSAREARAAESVVKQAAMNAQLARAHYLDLLVAITNEAPAGLKFDDATGAIYREEEADGE